MTREQRSNFINSIDKVLGKHYLSEEIADYIIVEGIANVTLKSLVNQEYNITSSNMVKTIKLEDAEKIMAAIEFYQSFTSIMNSFKAKYQPSQTPYN